MADTGDKSWVHTRWGWLAIWSMVTAGLLCLVLAANLLKIHPWKTVTTERIDWYAGEHCELVNPDSFFIQRANFWSNLAYLAAGLFIFLRHRTIVGRGTGIALGFLCIGSAAFHGTLTVFGQYVDIMGVYMALLAIGFHGVIEIFGLNPSPVNLKGWFIFTMSMGVFAGFSKQVIPWHESTVGSGILGGGLMFFLVYGMICYRESIERWIWPSMIALVSFGVAMFFKFADGHGHVLCAQEGFFSAKSLVQGHALWHVCSALMMLSLYESYSLLRGRVPSLWAD